MWSKSYCLYAQLRIFNLFKLIGYTISLLMHAHRSFHVTTQLFVNATKQKLLIIVRKKNIYTRAQKYSFANKKCSFAKKMLIREWKCSIANENVHLRKKKVFMRSQKKHTKIMRTQYITPYLILTGVFFPSSIRQIWIFSMSCVIFHMQWHILCKLAVREIYQLPAADVDDAVD